MSGALTRPPPYFANRARVRTHVCVGGASARAECPRLGWRSTGGAVETVKGFRGPRGTHRHHATGFLFLVMLFIPKVLVIADVFCAGRHLHRHPHRRRRPFLRAVTTRLFGNSQLVKGGGAGGDSRPRFPSPALQLRVAKNRLRIFAPAPAEHHLPRLKSLKLACRHHPAATVSPPLPCAASALPPPSRRHSLAASALPPPSRQSPPLPLLSCRHRLAVNPLPSLPCHHRLALKASAPPNPPRESRQMQVSTAAAPNLNLTQTAG